MTVEATTTALVKAHVGDTSADATLYDSLILGVSRSFERFLGYELEQKSRAETYSVEPGDRVVNVRNWPLVSVSSVQVAAEGVWDFAAYDALTADSDYRIVGNELYFYSGLIVGADTLKITYIGGMGTSTANLVTAAPDVTLAANIQVSEEYRRRKDPGRTVVPGAGGTNVTTSYHGLLQRVRQLLQPRRRMVFRGASLA